MSEKNKEIVKKINEAIGKGNFEVFFESCAEDVTWTLIGNRSIKGRENIRQWMASMGSENSEPPTLTVTDPVIAEGDFVVARGNMSMKDKDGKQGNYSYCDVYRFQNDKVIELNSFVIKAEPKSEASSGG